MSVVIHNISPKGLPNDQEHDYEVRINWDHIAYFKHKRNDGLAACLRRAADAVDNAREGKEWKGNQ